MFQFFRVIHNRWPILSTVVAFITAVAMATAMSIWWNYLLIENHRILREMTSATVAAERSKSALPVALVMMLGLASSLMVVLGLIYMFLRLVRAVQLNLAQSQFIASVTHELRSPLASLQLLLETIRDPTTPLERRQEFEACMQADVTRLRSLVDQVLETARLETFSSNRDKGRTREAVELSKLLATCFSDMMPRLKATDGELRFEAVNVPAVKVRANASLLSTVVGSVLDNAVKYADGPPRIRVSVREDGPHAVIEINDSGIGIAKAEQKKIFRRFYRATDPKTRYRSGTGLGLYFARLAMRSQGGDIAVESLGRGEGAVFSISIPKDAGQA